MHVFRLRDRFVNLAFFIEAEPADAGAAPPMSLVLYPGVTRGVPREDADRLRGRLEWLARQADGEAGPVAAPSAGGASVQYDPASGEPLHLAPGREAE
jgi:hypothetical protein